MNQAETLKTLRKKRGLSQKELSNLTGITQSTLAKLESGYHKGTVEVLTTLANFYNVSVDYIICNPQRNELIDILLENLVHEGIVDLDRPFTPEVEDLIKKTIDLKIQKLKENK